jgi:16S rRNA (cytosine967-C5)-methyltransferase
MTSVRKLAVDALGAIETKGAKARVAVELRAAELDLRDRAFLMELVYGVLRRRDTLDWVLAKFMRKPPGGATRNSLRAAVYQLLYMRVPEFAVVDEAVSLESRYRAMANAVLRNIVRSRQEIREELNTLARKAEDDTVDRKEFLEAAFVITSHPRWLLKRWEVCLGRSGALALARANNEVPLLTLRVNALRATRDEVLSKLRDLGIEASPTNISPVGIRLEGTLPFAVLEPLRGLVSVQDEAAQLVSLMLDPHPGQRVLDACAAPGGKATHLAQLMDDSGEVVAVELEEKRIPRMRENIEALDLHSISIRRSDILEFEDEGGFDRVMVDAPCSALGVIRRNPDVRYRHRPADLKEFGRKQLEILSASAGHVRPGGSLVYCTCSTEPEEGEEVVSSLLRTHGEFFIIEDVPAVRGMLRNGMLRTYPHVHGTDGFFAVRIGRRT